MRVVALAIATLSGCSFIIDPPPHQEHPDVLVNGITTGQQANVAAVFADGRYMAVWQDGSLNTPDSDKKAVRGRFLSKAGVPEQSDFIINVTTAGSQDHPQIAAIGGNRFVVWSDDNGDIELRGRIVTTAGDFIPSSMEVPINSTVPGKQEEHQLIAASETAFLVVWADNSAAPPMTEAHVIRGRLFDTTGAPLKDSAMSELPDFVISTKPGDEREPALARGADGTILVVWTDVQALGDPGNIRGRRLRPDGTFIDADDFQINVAMDSLKQAQPYPVALQSGEFLVAWTDGNPRDADADGMAVRACKVPATAGGLPGNDFVLNERTQGDEGHPKMIRLPDSSLFLSFEDKTTLLPDIDDNGVRARRLTPDGTPAGDEVEVNTYYKGAQEDTALAADLDGNVLVFWEDGSASPPDGNSDAVRSRLYAPGPL